ncbi:MAG: lysylphosphatidylglycerol synthase domain-containing protein [Sulfolobales archaeon]
MVRAKGVARVILTLLLGISALVVVAKYVLSIDIRSALGRVAMVPIEVLALALLARSVGPVLHSTQFYLLLRSCGYGMSFKKTVLVVYSTLALEYVVPVGGVTEVGRVALLVREGVPPDGAVLVTFLHRLAHSLFTALELALVLLLVRRIDGLTLWLIVVTSAVNAINLAALTSARSPRVSRLLDRAVSKLGFKSPNPRSFTYPGLNSLAAVLAVIGLEKLSMVFSGHLVLSRLASSIGLPQSFLLFDILLTTFWLLPIVTPAGVGQVESVQLMASTAMNVDSTAALSAFILYRLVTLAAVLPQLLVALAKYGLSIVLGTQSLGKPACAESLRCGGLP